MTSLTLEEAVPLGYALMSHVAAEAGVRALAIKGPVLELQGLREPRTSVDIDLLVEPAGYPVLAAELESIGWMLRDNVTSPQLMAPHSTSYQHPSWPCEVDLHHYYPGFLADPSAVFDVLWARRTTVRLAGRDVPAPDRVDSAAVHALHFLRIQTNDVYRVQLIELTERIRATWAPQEVSDLAVLAADTGATEPLGPLLDELGVAHVEPTVPLAVATQDWHLWTHAESRISLRFLAGVQRASWRRRPGLVWRALTSVDGHEHALAGLSRSDRARFRLRRVRVGLRAMPSAAAELRRLRRRPDVDAGPQV